jgi:hypothetical protein
VKNITVSVPDDVYRAARIAAAERETTVSAIVADHLRSLSGARDSDDDLDQLIGEIRASHPGLRMSDNLTRDELHDRTRARMEAELVRLRRAVR